MPLSPDASIINGFVEGGREERSKCDGKSGIRGFLWDVDLLQTKSGLSRWLLSLLYQKRIVMKSQRRVCQIACGDNKSCQGTHLKSDAVVQEEVMKKRQKEADDAYEAQWDGGRGSHHPDYDPYAFGEDVVKASRQTEELYNAIVTDDVKKVYQKIQEGADVNFVFGRAYRSPEGYTPLMVAAHRCDFYFIPFDLCRRVVCKRHFT